MRYCWHSWEQWKQSSQADLKLNKKIVGRLYIQERRCTACGFVERHVQKVWTSDVAYVTFQQVCDLVKSEAWHAAEVD